MFVNQSDSTIQLPRSIKIYCAFLSDLCRFSNTWICAVHTGNSSSNKWHFLILCHSLSASIKAAKKSRLPLMSGVWRAAGLSVRDPCAAHSRLDWCFFRKCSFFTMLVRWKQKSAIDRVLGGGWPVVEVRLSCWSVRGELEGFLGPLRADEEGSGGHQTPSSLSLSLSTTIVYFHRASECAV